MLADAALRRGVQPGLAAGRSSDGPALTRNMSRRRQQPLGRPSGRVSMPTSRRLSMALFVACVTLAVCPVARAASPAPFSDQAFQAAQTQGKPILVEITAGWCTVCARQRPNSDPAPGRSPVPGPGRLQCRFRHPEGRGPQPERLHARHSDRIQRQHRKRPFHQCDRPGGDRGSPRQDTLLNSAPDPPRAGHQACDQAPPRALVMVKGAGKTAGRWCGTSLVPE